MTEVAKVFLKAPHLYDLGIPNTSCTWANQKEDGSWELLYFPSSCRSYMQCYWWKTLHEPKYATNLGAESGLAPETDRTCIYVEFKKLDKDKVDEAIKFLHYIEDEAGIPHTTLLIAEGAYTVMADGRKKEHSAPLKGAIFVGDKAWGSTLWKISLYSLLICKVLNNTRGEGYREAYYEYFTDFRKQFLAKVKDCNEEVIHGMCTSYTSIHCASGFVSIALGYNTTMSQILEIKK
jgi:hypothetical protein